MSLLKEASGAWSSQVSGAGWGDDEDEDGDGDNGWDEWGGESGVASGVAGLAPPVMDTGNECGYRIVEVQAFSLDVLQKIDELKDLYNFEQLDPLIIIARHYKWSESKMQNWFSEPENMKFEIGVEFDTRLSQQKPEINATLPENHGGYCMICYEEINEENSFALECKHTFCNACWQEYLHDRIQSGFLGIDSLCMQQGCNLKVGHSVFEKFLDSVEEDRDKYWKWLIKSLTDENPEIRWCPNHQCELSCERTNSGKILMEIECTCGTKFCFMCGLTSHLPCDCQSAKLWIEKESAESENTQWILANTKACPGCKGHIQKNQGCNHMTCSACKHHFCWICMGPWSEHGGATGGYYECNLYEKKKKNDAGFAAFEAQQSNAASELEHYLFLYERFNGHAKSKQLAEKLLVKLEEIVHALVEVMNYPVSELGFLAEACEVVIESREVLAWTYAFSYFKSPKMDEMQKVLFQQWQTDLEKYCDHLQEIIEKPLDQYIDLDNQDRTPFYLFRGELTQYFQATKNFTTNMQDGVKEIIEQLEEADGF